MSVMNVVCCTGKNLSVDYQLDIFHPKFNVFSCEGWHFLNFFHPWTVREKMYVIFVDCCYEKDLFVKYQLDSRFRKRNIYFFHVFFLLFSTLNGSRVYVRNISCLFHWQKSSQRDSRSPSGGIVFFHVKGSIFSIFSALNGSEADVRYIY